MSATEFVPIRVSTLRGEINISFNAYIKVAGKFILYCREGDNFEGERLKKLRAKRLKKMYISPEDEEKYRKYMTASIEAAYDKNSDAPIESRAEVVQGAQQAAAEEVMENPKDPVAYDIAKMGTERYVEFILSEDDALKSVLSIENTDHSIAEHGVNVATLAIAVAKELGMDKTHNMELLTLGCLLHDFEHMESGQDVARPVKEFSKEELALYKSHPKTGAEKVIHLKHFDKDVIDIIHEHEELVNGTGFPKGLKEKEINPLALIAGTANAYDRIVSFEGVEPKEALKTLLVAKMGLYPLGHMQALQKVLKSRGVIA